MMTRISVVLAGFLGAMVLATVACAAQAVVIFVDNGYPPYAYDAGKGKAAGIYVDVLTEAFSMVDGYAVEIRPTPWKRGMNMVREGKALGICPPYRTSDRLPWMAFSEPILQEQVVVFGTR